jgi:3-methyl-2-oxobutanoate hydroxymethyltransferase
MTKLTLTDLGMMKKDGRKIACLTAYDAGFSRILDESGVDAILVGDSLGMALQGHATTLGVTLADMIYHTRMVTVGCRRALIITDMPFMSYATPARALGSAERLIGEGGAEVVKLEGGAVMAETINYLSARGIAVCAHLGLTPQSIHKLGGYHVQGREQAEAEQILADARHLAAAGASLLVLECVPHELASAITRQLSIPVIGIGAGADCDGQVLVLYDILGITERQPRFSQNFLQSTSSIQSAVTNYVAAVKSGSFPAAGQHF